MNRNVIKNEKFTLAIMCTAEDFHYTENFDCGNEDLNDFFQHDALAHSKQLLATTYYFQPNKATEEKLSYPVAFVSFLNDTIEVTREKRKTSLKKFFKILRESVPYPKSQYPFFPAVKIGRLGVKKSYQRQGIGTALLNMVKELFLTENRTGCRYLTVDAYNDEKTILFYKKNGFNFLSEDDKGKPTRIMFYDLMRHKIEETAIYFTKEF